MGNRSAKPIFPLSFKVVAVSNKFVDTIPELNSAFAPTPYSYIGFQIIPPYDLYTTKALQLHFKCQFDAGVSSINKVLQKISVGGTTFSSPNSTSPSVLVNYTPTAGVMEFTINLTSLLTPTGDATIYLHFPAGLSANNSFIPNSINLLMLKAEMLYQVKGIR